MTDSIFFHLSDPEARDIYLDDTYLSFEADDVQEGFENLNNFIVFSASPGFTWGRSGNCPTGTWLLNDTVPSNRTGRNIFLYNAQIEMVYTSNQNISTYNLSVYEHNKVAYTLLYTLNVVAAYGNELYLPTPVSVTKGKELAMYISSGSAFNITAGLLMTGKKIP